MVGMMLRGLAGRLPVYLRLRRSGRRAGRDLRLVQNNLDRINDGSILLVCCLRSERPRLPFFYDYYKRLGVDHFILIDNGSTDGFADWAKGHDDVSTFYTEASYKGSRFGMLWCNDILRRYGVGHWCITVDPDEFLVYPNMETRSLKALTLFLDEERRPCMHAVMLDAYSDRPLRQTVLGEGDDPFKVCPYFDRDGYIQLAGWGGGTVIRGGPRLRMYFADQPNAAPALNKIPLVKWKSYYHYTSSTHDARPFSLNRAHTPKEVSVTGALFHFKMVTSLVDKAAEEMQRREHFAGGREYERYAKSEGEIFYAEGISVAYRNSQQLVDLGLMSAGRWF